MSFTAEQLAQFRAAMLDTWNVPIHVEKYIVYEDAFTQTFQAVTELLIDAIDPKPGQRILDIATGTGPTAFALAQRVGPSGGVHGTDISTEFVRYVQSRAAAAGLSNVTAELLDVHDLAVVQDFDAAVCRFAVMYFADPIDALRRIRTALRSGGRFATAVWTDPSQALFASTFGSLSRFVELPAPLPGAPSAFRYAQPGTLAAEFTDAGFVDVAETTHEIAAHWPGTGADVWDFFAGALQTPLATLDDATRTQLDAEVAASFDARRDDNGISLPLRLHITIGTTPG